MSIVVLTGARAPYTHLLYEALGEALDEPLHVLACTERETTRQWRLPPARAYRFEVLPGIRLTRSLTSTVYFNPSVVRRIAVLAPRLLIVNDFSPTSLFATIAARARGIPVGVRTDGVPATDPGSYSYPHRFMRHVIVSRSDFGIGPSAGSLALLQSYGLAPERLVRTHLFPGWRPIAPAPGSDERGYDLLFCGTLDEPIKGARFFTEVALLLAQRGQPITVRVTGEGPMRAEMESRLSAAGIPARFDGFVDQADLEPVYGSARLFLFPTRGDVWGVVVNESMQCGTPVLASPHATAATELLAPARAGVVAPLDVAGWADAVQSMLQDRQGWASMQANGLAAQKGMTAEDAAADYRKVVDRYAQDVEAIPEAAVPSRR